MIQISTKNSPKCVMRGISPLLHDVKKKTHISKYNTEDMPFEKCENQSVFKLWVHDVCMQILLTAHQIR